MIDTFPKNLALVLLAVLQTDGERMMDTSVTTALLCRSTKQSQQTLYKSNRIAEIPPIPCAISCGHPNITKIYFRHWHSDLTKYSA